MGMHRRAGVIAIAMAALLPLVGGCGSSTGPRSSGTQNGNALAGKVQIDGSSTVYPISEAMAEEFTGVQPRVRVTVGFSGTGGGMKKFINHEIDICDASRQIKSSEKQACADAGIEYLEMEIAYDGLAVVVHKQNDWAACLTVEQLKSIWRPGSSVNNWSDVDPSWPNEKIALYAPGADSGTFDYFTEVIVGESKASRTDEVTFSEDDNVLVTGVSQDKHALGYFGYAYFSENKDRLRLVAINGGGGCVKPSSETVLSGAYAPLSRPLFLYINTTSLARPEVREFVTFYLDSVQSIAEEVGYVKPSDERLATNRKLLDEAVAGPDTARADAAAALVNNVTH